MSLTLQSRKTSAETVGNQHPRSPEVRVVEMSVPALNWAIAQRLGATQGTMFRRLVERLGGRRDA